MDLTFHVHILGTNMQDMKFLWTKLWLGGLTTDDIANANDNNDDDKTQQTIAIYVKSQVYKDIDTWSIKGTLST